MVDYTAIIKRSFGVVKKNKWLLVYGALLAGAGGGGGSNLNVGDFSELQNIFKQNQEGLPEKTSRVLGSFTSSLKEWLVGVGPEKWFLLGIGVLLTILLSVAIAFVVQAWAKGSLIAGVQMGLKDNQVNLKNTSPVGLANIKNLIIFSFLMTAISITALIILSLTWTLFFLVFKEIVALKIFWIIVGVFLAILAFFVIVVLFTMISIYAERLIVLKGYKPWEAWKEALKISKKSFISTLVMGILNSIINSSVGCIGVILLLLILGIPTFFLLYPSLSKGQFPMYSIFPLLVLIIVFIFATMIIRAALVVFTYSNWNQIFNSAFGESTSDSEEPMVRREQKNGK